MWNKTIKKLILLLMLCACAHGQGSAIPPYSTVYIRTLLDDPDAATGRTTLQIDLTEFAPLLLAERSSDPAKPTEGKMKLWMSDGTEYGDDGDLIIAATAGGITKIGILWDFSAAVVWNGLNYTLLLESGDALLLETGDRLLLE